MFITIMVSEESRSCKCYDSNAPVSYYTEGVSFSDNISDVASESLFPKGLLIRVLLQGLGVVFGVCTTNVCFLGVED
jgi:hypothetical protein